MHTITLRTRTFIAIPWKSTLKYISSHIFWDRALKLCSCILGTKIKRLGMRPEFWFRPQKWKYQILKIGNGHFWRFLAYLQIKVTIPTCSTLSTTSWLLMWKILVYHLGSVCEGSSTHMYLAWGWSWIPPKPFLDQKQLT